MTRTPLPLIVIVPVFEDRESATILIKDLARQLENPPHIIIVEDGSVRAPSVRSMISDAGLSGEIIYLARNVGHQRAIAVGICYVARRYEPGAVIVMDADGEDKPESVPHLLARLAQGRVDVVTATRRKRSESLKFRAFYFIYRYLFSFVTGKRIRFGNFTALSQRAVQRLAAMSEIWIHFPASLIISRLVIGAVDTDRGQRYAGRSQMNFISLTLHGLRSMMVFADSVLVRVVLVCTSLTALVIVLLLALTLMKIAGLAIPGWFSVASGILISLLLQSGILTFVTLMISGTMQSSMTAPHVALATLIERVDTTEGDQGRPVFQGEPRDEALAGLA